MEINRRNWLKQAGLGAVALSLIPADTLAVPTGANTGKTSEEDFICLMANENPYGPPPSAIRAMSESIAGSNRYNWDRIDMLIAAIAKNNGVDGTNVLLGAGSPKYWILPLIMPHLKKAVL